MRNDLSGRKRNQTRHVPKDFWRHWSTPRTRVELENEIQITSCLLLEKKAAEYSYVNWGTNSTMEFRQETSTQFLMPSIHLLAEQSVSDNSPMAPNPRKPGCSATDFYDTCNKISLFIRSISFNYYQISTANFLLYSRDSL